MESNNLSSVQQQLMEYRMRKKREAAAATQPQPQPQPISAPPEPAPVEPVIPEDTKEPIPIPEDAKDLTTDIRRESAIKDEEKLTWERKQDAYKRLLLEGELQPVKLKVFDFTQGSENLKRLEMKNYDFVSSNIISEPKYKKEDIKTLYSTIGIMKREPMESARQEVQLPITQLREEEKVDDIPGPEVNRPPSARMPLLINISREEEVRRDFLCFRNVNRDVIGLVAIFGLLAGVICLLFILSKVCSSCCAQCGLCERKQFNRINA
eukprot:TRINITY_DN6439_c0_g2_i11.p1 TRINITY_DN6439_c0_g2~~TRINITY_DN6439_c0_g2_i11.p1  ORF type:complete len:266 (+),score=63.93 TRINITY_DN6439_c0_g2_i11:152-949(+)